MKRRSPELRTSENRAAVKKDVGGVTSAAGEYDSTVSITLVTEGPPARIMPAWANGPGRCVLNIRAECPIYPVPQSLAQVLVHLIFSTKNREPFLRASYRCAAHSYLATVARSTGCACYRVGGISDHVHLAIGLSRTTAIANVVETLKTSSSKWLKTQSAEMSGFGRQRGYGVFSVSPSNRNVLCSYIDDQEEHHRTRSFQEEYRFFLSKYSVPFDERYVWD